MSYWSFFQNKDEAEAKNIFYLPPVIYPKREMQETIFRFFNQSWQKILRKRSIACLWNQYICLNHPKNCAPYSPTPVWNILPQEYRRQIAAVKFQNPDVLVSDDAYEILYYITCHFNDEITLKILCNELYITEQNAASILQKKFQISFHEMVAIFRLRYAQAMLLVSPMTLVDISACCGFQSVHTFIRLFRAKKHLTPTAYRKKYKERIYES